MGKEEKKKEVENLKELLNNHSVISIVNLHNMPAPQLQEIRKKLYGKGKIRMSKKTLMNFSLEKSKHENIEELEKFMKGEPAFLLSESNPFKLFKFLNKNKSSAPAKPGDIAPDDIVVKKGNTGLPPGPAIGQLSDVGIPAKVQEGNIHVAEDTVVASEGDKITPELANVLNTLDMKPMKIGLELVGAYEDGTIFEKEMLKIDEEKTMKKLQLSINRAVELSLESSYLTKLTTPIAVRKSYLKAKKLAKEAGIYVKDIMEDLIIKANTEKNMLKNKT